MPGLAVMVRNRYQMGGIAVSYNIEHHILLVTSASRVQVQVKWCRNFRERGTYEITMFKPGENAPVILAHEENTHEAIKTFLRVAHLIDTLGYDAVYQAYVLPF